MQNKSLVLAAGIFLAAVSSPGMAGKSSDPIVIEPKASLAGKELSTVSGAVTVGEAATVGSIETVSGEVRVGPDASAGDIESVSGVISLGKHSTASSLETVSGGINLGSDSKVTMVDTVSGDVMLETRSAATGGIETVSGNVTAGPDVKVTGPIETTSGSVRANGAGLASIETVSGRIELEKTTVSENIVTENGSVYLRPGTTVEGGITVKQAEPKKFRLSILGVRLIGPKKGTGPFAEVVVGPNVTVKGPLNLHPDVRLHVHDGAKVGRVTGPAAKKFTTSWPAEVAK